VIVSSHVAGHGSISAMTQLQELLKKIEEEKCHPNLQLQVFGGHDEIESALSPLHVKDNRNDIVGHLLFPLPLIAEEK
jgi:hypothetical protein